MSECINSPLVFESSKKSGLASARGVKVQRKVIRICVVPRPRFVTCWRGSLHTCTRIRAIPYSPVLYFDCLYSCIPSSVVHCVRDTRVRALDAATAARFQRLLFPLLPFFPLMLLSQAKYRERDDSIHSRLGAHTHT